MFNLEANIATKDITVTPVRQITHKNLNAELLILAHDITAANILRPHYPTLEVRINDLPRDLQGALNATRKGVTELTKGVPFTVNIASFANAMGGRGITTFAVRSRSRAEIIYTPTDFECQCEGHLNHGVCWHRALRRVFNNYVSLLAAQEAFVTAYAKMGVALTPPAPEPIDFGYPVVSEMRAFGRGGIREALEEMMTREAR